MIKSFSIYTAGKLLTYGMPAILVPIFTRVLSQADYGIINTFGALLNVLSIFILMSSTGAVSRAYMDKGKNDFDFSEYVGNALITNTLLFGIVYIPFIVINQFGFITLPKGLFYLIPIYILIQSLSAYKQKLWILQNKPMKFVFFEVGFKLATLLLSILLVVFIFKNWIGRISANFISHTIFCVISLFFLFKEEKVRFKYNKVFIIDVLKFGAPLTIHGIGLILLGASDILILNSLIGLNEVGVYGVALALSSIMLIFIMPYDQAIFPKIFGYLKNYTDDDAENIMKLLIINVLYLVLSGFLVGILCYCFGQYFVGPKFHEALNYVPLLLIGQIFYGLYRFSVRPIFFSKKTHLVSISTISSGIIGTIILYFLVLSYGIKGAAYGFVIAKTLSFVFVSFFSQKIFPQSMGSFTRLMSKSPKL